MPLRLLVVEGNVRAAREAHAAAYGLTPAESYAAVLGEIEPDVVCDIALPADEGANLPDPAGIEAYDGVVLTGSALHVYDVDPPVRRQVDLMRAVYASGVPAFGSCWGLQVATVAAGGEVRPNPAGREVGFARNVARTGAGHGHALLEGRPDAFTIPAIHLDAVAVPPPGATVLARNALSAVQAAEIAHGGGLFWGVQYHPEFSLGEVAAILERMPDALVAEGFCRSLEAAAGHVADLRALHADPSRTDLAWRHGLDAQTLDPVLRVTEIRNFVERRVKPQAGRRGRG
jgi:GMP synthase (glutamine-hydrolysing)